MPIGTTLRYDTIPVEDFLAGLAQHERDGKGRFLPRQENLKEAFFRGRGPCTAAAEGFPMTLFVLQEEDALSGRTEVFCLLHSEGRFAACLRDAGLALRAHFGARGARSFFRIDPRYGLVCGSALEPVDPSIKWDRPGAYVTLYLTQDAGSPALALLDYVPSAQKERFQSIFQAYNGVAAPAAGFLASAWKRLKGTEPVKSSAPGGLGYPLLKTCAAFLGRQGFKGVSVSLIYKDIGASEAPSFLLDADLATFFPSGHDRFFASLGELT